MGAKSQCFGGSLSREDGFRESCVGGIEVTVFRWLAQARNRSSGVVCWWDRSHGALVARFGEKVVFGSRLLVGAKSQRFGGSLRRDLFLSGDVCWCEKSHSALVLRLGENMVFGSRVLAKAKRVCCFW